MHVRAADITFNQDNIANVGVDLKIDTKQVHNKIVKIQLWDTAGSERFQSIMRAYYRNVLVVFLTIDCARDSAVKDLQFFYNDFKQYSTQGSRLIVVLSQRDLYSKQFFKEVIQKTKYMKLLYVETSSKTGDNVQLLVDYIAQIAVEEREVFE